MTEKLILFGAGNMGRQALEFYGAANVHCFVDNNPALAGATYLGKPVISFTELLSIHGDYGLVIACLNFAAISRQLEEAGIKNYGNYQAVKFLHDNEIGKYKAVAVYGVDAYTHTLLNLAEKKLFALHGLIDRAESPHLGRTISGCRVTALDEARAFVDGVIIAVPQYHLAIEARLERELAAGVKILNPFRVVSLGPSNTFLVNKYTGKNTEADSEGDYNKRCEDNEYTAQAIKAYVDEVKNHTPLFKLMEIETVNRCNGSCAFCPVNKKDDPRPFSLMPETLFKRIIDQLADIQYGGRLGMFSNNEPLLDERIVEFCVYARQRLPRARLHMFTNGTLFTLEKFKSLIPCLDELIIDNYQQELKCIKPVREILDYCADHPELMGKVTVFMRKPKEILTSRGGNAPNRRHKPAYPDLRCALPFQQFIIRPDGQVSLCCNDALGENTLGDVSQNSIMDVWYGKAFEDVRAAMAHGRKGLPGCLHCDAMSLYL